MNKDYNRIKKLYGERMAKLCRSLFPTLLDQETLLPRLLESKFNPTHFLYEDIMKDNLQDIFKNFIYNLVDVEKKEITINKSTRELLREVGYELYECKTESDIQSFKRYYKKGEELCTFDGGRLRKCIVFFAVKDNAEDLKREDFKEPKRQDEYGTSVISIQFDRGTNNRVSIKNRYNHTVNNPDSTFSNNLDNIVPGLSEAFSRDYYLNVLQNEDSAFELPDYVMGNDGRYYKYNYEINNIHYCPDNIIIDNGEVKKFEKEKYVVTDYFIVDLVKKEVKLYDDSINDSFVDGFKDINKIRINKKDKSKEIILTPENGEDIRICLDKENRIIEYENNGLVEVGNNFLVENISLKKLVLLNIVSAKHFFLNRNEKLIILSAPNLTTTGYDFLCNNKELEILDLPSLTTIGDNFFYHNKKIDNPKKYNTIELELKKRNRMK